MQITHIKDLIKTYSVLLFDAYGVLIKGDKALDHSIELINYLNNIAKPYLILTNGSSASPRDTAKRYQNMGLSIGCDKVITSGSLVKNWLAKKNLNKAPIFFLGPDGAKQYYTAQNLIFSNHLTLDTEIILIANQNGFDWLSSLNRLINHAFKRIENGLPLKIIIPNPDVIYPNAQGFGFTSGALAKLILEALSTRFENPCQYVIQLGKPHSTIFNLAKDIHPNQSMVMIGDQLKTDILGANHAKIASALIKTGISSEQSAKFSSAEMHPKYLLENLNLH